MRVVKKPVHVLAQKVIADINPAFAALYQLPENQGDRGRFSVSFFHISGRISIHCPSGSAIKYNPMTWIQ